MQKTGWTKYSSSASLPGLLWKRISSMDAITRRQCIWPFSAWWQTNKQPTVSSGSLRIFVTVGQSRPTAGKAYTGLWCKNTVLGWSQRERRKNNLEPWKRIKTDLEPWKTSLKPWKTIETHLKPWQTMQNQTGTMKNYENRPGTMKNHENSPGWMKN